MPLVKIQKNKVAIRRKRDELITEVQKLPLDTKLVGEILIWEEAALAKSVITQPELGRYYHLINEKTGTYERKTAA